jgi:hypothetical protein
MVKYGPGDYFIPNNNGTTLYRIRRYMPGGSFSLVQTTGETITGPRWEVLSTPMPEDLTTKLDEWFLNGDHWQIESWELHTRKEALSTINF